MILWIGIGSGTGLLFGFLLGFLLGRSGASARAVAERTRADGFAEDLSRMRTELENERTRASAAEKAQGALEETARQLGQQMTDLRSSLERAEAEAAQIRQDAHAAQIESAGLRKTLEAEKNAAAEKLAARGELSNQFEVLANRIFEEKSKSFTDLNQANLTSLTKDLREKFGEFQQKVESLKDEGIAGRAALTTQIEGLKSLNERLSEDAENLVTALKGSSKVQGDWGEFVLERLLQSAGLRKGLEYRAQETFERDEGGNSRLDYIIDLPDDRHVVIDSKVSLNDYRDFCNCEDSQEKKVYLKQHLASIRNHVRELSGRRYQEIYSLNSLDFVFLFVPIEPAYTLAIANDDRLWDDAWRANVILVSPSGIFSMVRTVAQLWRQERQNRNVEEIARRGRILYDKFVGFTEDLLQVGRKLGDAREAYEKALNRLTRSSGNLISQAQKLVNLGIKPSKTLPPLLIEQSVESDESPEPSQEADESLQVGPEADESPQVSPETEESSSYGEEPLEMAATSDELAPDDPLWVPREK